MTQAINFDELINAFAPEQREASVTSIQRTPERKNTQDADESKVTLQLKDELLALKDSHGALKDEHKKALRHLNLLLQDKERQETEIKALHENKLQHIRQTRHKNDALAKASSELNSIQQLNRQLEIKLGHKKVDLKKSTLKNQALSKENDTLKNEIIELKTEILAIQKAHSMPEMTKSKLRQLLISLLETLSEKLSAFSKNLNRSENTADADVWYPIKQKKPAKNGTYLVRNGYRTELGYFNKKAKSFYVMSDPDFVIIEWSETRD